MTIAWFTGSVVLIIFAFLWLLIQFGVWAAMVFIVILAVVIAALIGAAVWLITAIINAHAKDNGAHF